MVFTLKSRVDVMLNMKKRSIKREVNLKPADFPTETQQQVQNESIEPVSKKKVNKIFTFRFSRTHTHTYIADSGKPESATRCIGKANKFHYLYSMFFFSFRPDWPDSIGNKSFNFTRVDFLD